MGAAVGEIAETPLPPLLDELTKARSGLEAAAATDPESMGSALLVEGFDAVAALRRQVEALYLQLLHAVDTRGVATDAGMRSTAAWLRERSRGSAAERDVAVAEAVAPDGPLAELGTALAAGEVTRHHVDVAVRALAAVPAHMVTARRAEVAGFLTDEARAMHPAQFAVLAKQLLAVLDPDGQDRADSDAVDRRGLSMAVDAFGMLVGEFRLDPAAGAEVAAAVQHFAAPQAAAPAGSSVEAVGDGWAQGALPPVVDRRNATQRRADALTLMARAAMGSTGERGGEPPRVVVHVTPEQLAAAAARTARTARAEQDADVARERWHRWAAAARHADERDADGVDDDERPAVDERDADTVEPRSGAVTTAVRGWSFGSGSAQCEQTGPLDPATLERLVCDAVLERVTVDPHGHVLDYGRSRRLVTPVQRKALAVRDGGCVIPGCGALPGWTDGHHVRGWVAERGPTDLDELVLLCPSHHTQVHLGRWRIEMRDGLPWVVPPRHLDPQQRPIRAAHPHPVERSRRLAGQLARQLALDDTG